MRDKDIALKEKFGFFFMVTFPWSLGYLRTALWVQPQVYFSYGIGTLWTLPSHTHVELYRVQPCLALLHPSFSATCEMCSPLKLRKEIQRLSQDSQGWPVEFPAGPRLQSQTLHTDLPFRSCLNIPQPRKDYTWRSTYYYLNGNKQ